MLGCCLLNSHTIEQVFTAKDNNLMLDLVEHSILYCLVLHHLALHSVAASAGESSLAT